DAARSCGMSSSRLMSFFKAATGQTFLAYLNHFRIAKAQALLFTTDMPISEISHEVGFCDQSHFGVLFRKVVGLSPLTYRSRLQQAEEKPLKSTSELRRPQMLEEGGLTRPVHPGWDVRQMVTSAGNHI